MTQIIHQKDNIYSIAADHISTTIHKLLEKKDQLNIGIVGGSSIPKLFSFLKDKPLDWKKIHVFLVDERFVSLDHQDSNFHLIHKNIQQIIPDSHLHPFRFDEGTEQDAITEYEKEFRSYTNRCDLVICSSGEDGHIGSLFPHHPSIKDDSEYFILVHDSPKPPSHRMSMSKNLLLRSEYAYLFIVGTSKLLAYQLYENPELSIEDCPSKLIDKIDKSFVFTEFNTGI